MTLSLSWRMAPVILAAAALLLAGCGSTPTDELSGKSAEKLYAEAKDEMESGSYERAIKALERVEGLGAGTLLAQQAQLDLAYLYWKTAEKAQALSTIDRFIKLNPSSAGLDYALYLRGLINFIDDLGLFSTVAGQDMSERDQRSSRDAYQAFKQLTEQFPDSVYAGDARERMARIIDSLAAYEVHVARYYFRRGAYVAAANRAQQAVTEFQNSPAVEEALYILMSSYEKLDLDALRDDAARVLKQNFPDSRYLSIGLADKQAWWRLW
jgi:outer membrane protein assembly factor BamD